jgi:hypothetical protein
MNWNISKDIHLTQPFTEFIYISSKISWKAAINNSLIVIDVNILFCNNTNSPSSHHLIRKSTSYFHKMHPSRLHPCTSGVILTPIP